MTTYRLHRDIFPQTDFGYTWIESYWFERDGERISAISPAGGCTERLGHLPGGSPDIANLAYDLDRFDCTGRAPVKSETVHQGAYRVTTACVIPA